MAGNAGKAHTCVKCGWPFHSPSKLKRHSGKNRYRINQVKRKRVKMWKGCNVRRSIRSKIGTFVLYLKANLARQKKEGAPMTWRTRPSVAMPRPRLGVFHGCSLWGCLHLRFDLRGGKGGRLCKPSEVLALGCKTGETAQESTATTASWCKCRARELKRISGCWLAAG